MSAIYFCGLYLLTVLMENIALPSPPFSGGVACLLATIADFVY
jgi:hypothetical protein